MKSIIPILPKGEMVYPLKRSNEIPAIPVVKEGQKVVKGQKIAETSGKNSAPVYATVSGKIKTVSHFVSPRIVIENDEEYQECEYEEMKSLEEYSPKDIFCMISDAGILFNRESPCSVNELDKVKEICVDMRGHHSMIESYLQEIVNGLKILLKVFENARGVFLFCKRMPKVRKKIKQVIQTEERMTIEKGKQEQQVDVERIAVDADTLVAVYDAITNGRPLTERVISFLDSKEGTEANVRVLLGTNLKHLIQSVAGDNKSLEEINIVDKNTGECVEDLDTPITQNTAPVFEIIDLKTPSIYWTAIAIIPLLILGIIRYGFEALHVLSISMSAALLSGFLLNIIKKEKNFTNSIEFIVIGLLIGLCLPPSIPWWICCIGPVFSVFMTRCFASKIPALSGVCVIHILFAEKLKVDIGTTKNIFDLYVGNAKSVIGGVSVVAVLIGAIILVVKGIADIRMQGSALLSFIVLVMICGEKQFDLHYIGMYICNGTLMLMIWFMMNEFKCQLKTSLGMVAYGLFTGILFGILAVLGYLTFVPLAILFVGGTILFMEDKMT